MFGTTRAALEGRRPESSGLRTVSQSARKDLAMSKLRILVVSLAVAVFALVQSSAAKADSATCSPSSVSLDFGGAGARLILTCDGVVYYTNPGGSCPTLSIDAVKLFENMSMSALLAGKKVSIFFPTLSASCGVPAIGNLSVLK
jgi:hypothetical protein